MGEGPDRGEPEGRTRNNRRPPPRRDRPIGAANRERQVPVVAATGGSLYPSLGLAGAGRGTTRSHGVLPPEAYGGDADVWRELMTRRRARRRTRSPNAGGGRCRRRCRGGISEAQEEEEEEEGGSPRRPRGGGGVVVGRHDGGGDDSEGVAEHIVRVEEAVPISLEGDRRDSGHAGCIQLIDDDGDNGWEQSVPSSGTRQPGG